MTRPSEAGTGLSRRSVIGAAGAGALALGAIAGYGVRAAADEQPVVTDLSAFPVEFTGKHQAGITTPAQDRLHLAVFDVTTQSREDLIALLQEWTEAARKLAAGNEVGQFGAVAGLGAAPPEDTGEALGLSASQ
ncbi:MAG: Dyp-type peroxidase, partial [Propionibacteriales bacterium]|nr:Dyp-type peroxidase [Propionibacteriales bacterium]